MISAQWRFRLFKASFIAIPLSIFLLIKIALPTIKNWYDKSLFETKSTTWETKHFRFRSAEKSKNKQISKLVETFYLGFCNRFKNIPFRNLTYKPEIHILGSREEFRRRHKRRYLKDLPHNDAFYNPSNRRIDMHWDSISIKRVLYHELTHLLLDLVVQASYKPQWSLWFNEGLAGYCERCVIVDKKLVPKRFDPKVAYRLKRAIDDKTILPIKKLLNAKSKDFEGEENYLYYDQSYALIYFLMHSDHGKNQAKFYRYFREEKKTGPLSIQIFWRIMGTPKIFC